MRSMVEGNCDAADERWFGNACAVFKSAFPLHQPLAGPPPHLRWGGFVRHLAPHFVYQRSASLPVIRTSRARVSITGVATFNARPFSTSAPAIESISVARPARISCSIDG